MRIAKIEAGLFKLDGGAMFGVVPKTLWNKLNPADENNMCTWALRCLLIDTGDRKILVDTGIGDKEGEKFRSHFHPHGPYSLKSSLDELKLTPEDITDVFLTHFHFDHVGGAVDKTEDGNLVPAFPNATYWSNEQHYEWAYDPNAREKASYMKRNFVPLKEQGVLEFIGPDERKDWIDGIEIRFCSGHTDSMMILLMKVRGHTIVYCADLIPSSYHVRLPYIMAYDVRPLDTLDEKSEFLEEAVEQGYILFFEHDPDVECATLKRDDRGRIVVDETFALEERFPFE